jgi:putative flippase GtrA
MRKADHSIGWFLAIGGAAGLVHYLVTIGLNAFVSLRPGAANLVGFVCAFPVSYFGHRGLSFAATEVPHQRALPRLFAVSGMAFVGNQALLLTLLKLTSLPLYIALAIVLFVVSISTFLLSRGWVFARQATASHDPSDPER